MKLEDKIALVTGGASGIGAATAIKLAAEGAKTVVADINGAGASATVDAIIAAGGTATAVEVDIADERTIEAMYATTISTYGSLDLVHNTAAAISLMNDDQNVHDADADLWTRTFAANARGTALSCKHALRQLLPSGGGVIVNMASTAGIVGDVTYPAYASSKASIMATTRWIATNYGREGIRCNAIAPGLILSPGAKAVMDQRAIDMYQRHTPSTRLGEPEDIAGVALFLSTDEAFYVNGTVLTVDGGMTVHMPSWADSMDDGR